MSAEPVSVAADLTTAHIGFAIQIGPSGRKSDGQASGVVADILRHEDRVRIYSTGYENGEVGVSYAPAEPVVLLKAPTPAYKADQ